MYPTGVLSTASPSPGRVLGAASGSGEGKGNPHSEDREGVTSLRVPGCSRSFWSVGLHVFLMMFPNKDLTISGSGSLSFLLVEPAVSSPLTTADGHHEI